MMFLASFFVGIAPSEASGDAYFRLSPNQAHFLVGETFYLDVMINTMGHDTDAADVILSYDDEYIELLDGMPSVPGLQAEPGDAYQFYPGNVVDEATNMISITGFSVAEPLNTGTSEVLFARLHFKALKATSKTPVSFEFIPWGADYTFIPGSSIETNIAESVTSQDILKYVESGEYSIGGDTNPPDVIAVTPSDGQNNTIPTTPIDLKILDGESGVDLDTVAVTINGDTYTVDGAHPFGFAGNPFEYHLSIDRGFPFNYGQVYDIMVTASDFAGNETTEVFTFTVGDRPPNEKPVMRAIGSRIITAGNELLFLVQADDPNSGDTLTIEMENAPVGAELLAIRNGVSLFKWTPTMSDVDSIINSTFRVYDNGEPALEDAQSMTITVVAPQSPIIISPESPAPQINCPVCAACGQRTQCQDNIDNDLDGQIDWPRDLECSERADDDESVLEQFGGAWNVLQHDLGQLIAQLPGVTYLSENVFNAAAVEQNASLRFAPASGTFYPGQRVDIPVVLNTGNQATDAIDVLINYDPLYFEVVDAMPNVGGIQIQPGTIYEHFIVNKVDPVAGTIALTGFSSDSLFNSGDGSSLVAIIPMRALQAGENIPLTYVFAPGETTDSNVVHAATGTDILGSVTNAFYTIVADATPPTIQNFTPPNGSVNRSVTEPITFQIMDTESAINLNALDVWVDNVEYTLAGPHQFVASGSGNNYAISVYAPTFPYSHIVSTHIDAKDEQGNTMSTFASSYTTIPEPNNNAPEVMVTPDWQVDEGTSLTFLVRVTDLNTTNTLTYSMDDAPLGATLTKVNNDFALFEWTPPVGLTTFDYYPTVRVEDNGIPHLSDTQIVHIAVTTREVITEEPAEAVPVTREDLINYCPPCPVCPQCLDGRDNDGDGYIDYPSDPGCLSATDATEAVDVLPYCSDGIDNDGDGIIDYPFDPGCESAGDTSEIDLSESPACSDGLDNDGDGMVDYPDDPGCRSAGDNEEVDRIEVEALPACADGRDNDGDGYIDYPKDPDCSAPSDTSEEAASVVLSGDLEDFLDASRALLASVPVQEANKNILSPLLIGLNMMSTLVAGVPVGLFLLFLLSSPWFIIFGKKRRIRGLVYDSLRKIPVRLAVVRIMDAATKKQMALRITNRKGEYFFEMDKGEYYIEVEKDGYVYPSGYMHGHLDDEKYSDLYYGDLIDVTEDNVIVAPNIPIDPVTVETPVTSIPLIKQHIWNKKFHVTFAVASALLSLVLLIITPTSLIAVFFVVHLLIVGAYFWIDYVPSAPMWGVVRDAQTGQPVPGALIRVFDQEHKRLLETKVSDSKGRYGFFMGANKFLVTGRKPGYDPDKEVIDWHNKTHNNDLELEHDEPLSGGPNSIGVHDPSFDVDDRLE